MNILSIAPDIDAGGSAHSLLHLAEGLVELGHKLSIVTIVAPNLQKPHCVRYKELGIEVRYVYLPYFPLPMVECRVPFAKNIARAARHFSGFAELRAIAEKSRPDLIHYNSYAALFAALALDGPAVLHARERVREPAPLLWAYRAAIRAKISSITAINNMIGAQAERLWGLPVSVVNNTCGFVPRFQEFDRSSPLRYGLIAQVLPDKGHLECLEACATAAGELRARGVEIHLFGGELPAHRELFRSISEKIHRMGLEDFVFFHGPTNHPEQEISRLHLAMCLETSGYPLQRSVIEAMCQGRAVLATGDDQSFVTRGQTGELVAAGNISALAGAMVRLADRETLERMGRTAAERAAVLFDPQINARETAKSWELAVHSRTENISTHIK